MCSRSVMHTTTLKKESEASGKNLLVGFSLISLWAKTKLWCLQQQGLTIYFWCITKGSLGPP